MFDVGLLYAIVAFIGVIVYLILLNRTRATKHKEAIDRPFCLVLSFFVLFGLVDGIWGLFFSDVGVNSTVGYRLFTYGFHGMAAFSAFFWAGYLIRYVKIEKKSRVVLNVIRGGLLISQMAILVSNVWTAKVFTVSGPMGADYVTGPLRPVLFWLQFAYYALMAAVIVARTIVNRDRSLYDTYYRAIIFSAIPLIAGIFQRIFPDAPMYSIGFLLCAVTIYAFNITSQREAYLSKTLNEENARLSAITSALSDDVELVYYVNILTNDYQVFTKGEYRSPATNEERDFFRDVIDNIGTVVAAEDVEHVRSLVSKETILNELADKPSYSFNYRHYHGTAIKYYVAKVVRATDTFESVIIGIFDDDERVRHELVQQEELRAAKEEAEAANRAKSQFLFNMSHDIRTPMNAILGFTDIAKKELDDPDAARADLDKVSGAGRHLLSLINDVLDMSRIENDKIRIEVAPLSLKTCIADVLTLVESQAAERNITITETSSIRHFLVFADETHLKRIFLNILTNSIKYTEKGGRITFDGRESPTDDPLTYRYTVTITDNGIGMSREYLEHIYEMFSRERNSTASGVQGTGLGMAITKTLVDLMDGTIAIDSEPGKGTKTTLTFPFRLASDKDMPKPEKNVAEAVDLKDKYVLLVEDNELNMEIAADILNEFGLKLDTATDGTVAVAKVKELVDDPGKARYDFILMDVQMPQMDGYTATRTIREMSDEYAKNVPIVAMTANVFDEDVRRSLDAGMNAHLGKPISVPDLTKILCSLLKK